MYAKFYLNFLKFKIFLKRVNVDPIYFIMPAVFSILSAIFEGISVSTVIPLLKGVFTMNFSFVKDLTVFKFFAGIFPSALHLNNTMIFVILLGVIFTAGLLKNVFRYFSGLIVCLHIRGIANTLRQIIFSRYLSFGKMFFDRSNIGSLYNVLVNFTTLITQELSSIHSFLSEFFTFLVYIAIMFAISWKLSLIVLVTFPIFTYSVKMLIEKIKKTSISYANHYGVFSNQVSNILSCIPLVKLYANEERERARFSTISTEIKNMEFSLDKKYQLISPLQEIIMLAIVLLAVSLMAFVVVKRRSTDVASLLIYFYLLRMSYRSFGCFSIVKSSLARVSGPISDIANVLSDKDKFFIPAGRRKFNGLNNGIEFKNLTFTYAQERQVLKDINFHIEKNKITAIVGPTGAGKTTLVNLLLRLYDSPPGSILIDGDDIRNFDLTSLLAHFAYVSQDIALFNDTIKNNIIYGLEDRFTEEKLIAAVKLSRLDNFISSLSLGFDTYIGDRGVKLSGGEKQRVSIARAFLKGAQILILDEATSSLDNHTERLIQEAIDEAVKDKTTIVIAHRLSTIKNADKIVVIEDGRFIEAGGLAELLEKKGKFFEYWEAQKFY
jgi:ATP-binding cassette, subfamily B, bacterial MsbA